jgi:hypothetical protein
MRKSIAQWEEKRNHHGTHGRHGKKSEEEKEDKGG